MGRTEMVSGDTLSRVSCGNSIFEIRILFAKFSKLEFSWYVSQAVSRIAGLMSFS